MIPGAVLWCSFKCRGNPAEYQVTYEDHGTKVTNLCAECFEVFKEKGPK